MSDTIQERLLAIARQRAEDRVVAEFGPAGGNPNAVPQDHIEWEAANEIDRLGRELVRMKEQRNALRARLQCLAGDLERATLSAIRTVREVSDE